MRAAGKAPLIDGQARVLMTELPKSRQLIEVGQRVSREIRHGRVLAVEGNKLQIAFDKAGTKKVIDSFVAPA